MVLGKLHGRLQAPGAVKQFRPHLRGQVPLALPLVMKGEGDTGLLMKSTRFFKKYSPAGGQDRAEAVLRPLRLPG